MRSFSGRVDDPLPLEQILRAANRWRSLLAIGLAAAISGVVVVTFWGRTGPSVEVLAKAGVAADAPTNGVSVTASGSAVEDDGSVDPAGPGSTALAEDAQGQQSTAVTMVTMVTAAVPVDGATPGGGVVAEPAVATSGLDDSTPEPPSPPATSTSIPSSTTLPPAAASPLTGSDAEEGQASPALIRVEVEDARLIDEALTSVEFSGFSGRGFVVGLNDRGSGVEVSVFSSSSGPVPMVIGYSSRSNDDVARVLSLLVNGDNVGAVEMTPTESWSEWATVTVSVDLQPGLNQVALMKLRAEQNSRVNLDYLEFG